MGGGEGWAAGGSHLDTNSSARDALILPGNNRKAKAKGKMLA